jgi:hypothetical protein
VNTTNTHKRPAWMLALLACVLLLAGVAAGCKSASTSSTASQADKKPMIESVAKFFVAQGALDIPGIKAGIYDPENIWGVATMTAAPAGMQKATITWVWEGDKIVLTAPSEAGTATLSASPTQANVVLLTVPQGGQGQTFVMKKDGGVWKIDVTETMKVAPGASTSSTPTP